MKQNEILKLLFVVAVVLTMTTTVVFAESDIEPSDYFQDQKVIAHGGGYYEGYDTTNSVPAVMQSIENGYKLIELDIDISADGKIIMIHDWKRTAGHYFGGVFKKKLKEAEFSELLVNGKFETLTFDKLVKIIDNADKKEETAGIRIITDTKGDNLTVLATIAEQYPAYIDRVIPQIYSYDEYIPVKEMGYEDIILTVYAMEKAVPSQVIEFAKKNALYAVTIPVDYNAEKIYKEVAAAGVKVYCHPIYTFEEAAELLACGVYGVYSGTVLPAEFEYPGNTIYITNIDRDGQKIKLTDCHIPATTEAVVTLPIAGLSSNQYGIYKIDGKPLNDINLATAESGKHILTIGIYSLNEKSIGVDTGVQLDYLLWKDEEGLRILDREYEYRTNAVKEQKDFDMVMERIAADEKLKISGDTIALLADAFIAKTGEYGYYMQGDAGIFKVGDDFLESQTADNGKTLVPLADTIKILGAKSVTMGSQNYIYINYDGRKITSQTGSQFVYVNHMSQKIATPITIYRSKAMAGGDLLELIYGRTYIDSQGILILLPDQRKLTEAEKSDLIKAAQELY